LVTFCKRTLVFGFNLPWSRPCPDFLCQRSTLTFCFARIVLQSPSQNPS
jgi:hypothetical protein